MRKHPFIRNAHWLCVLIIVLLYTTAYYRYWYTTQTEVLNWYLLVIHINLGVILLFLTLTMITIKLFIANPIPAPIPARQRWFSNLMHFCVYGLMLILPIVAYLGIGFDLPILGSISIPNPQRFTWINLMAQEYFDMSLITLTQPLYIFHLDTGPDVILPILLSFHIIAALYHHFVLKDQVLNSMLPPKQNINENQKLSSK